jgi:signal transduction histidine kinase
MWAMRGLTAALGIVLLTLAPSAWSGFVERPVEALVWLAAFLVANGFTLPAFGARGDVSLSAPVSVAVAVLFAPPLAAILNALGFWAPRELRGETIPTAALFNRAQFGVSVGAASLAVMLTPGSMLIGTVVAAAVYTLVNTLLLAVGFVLRSGERPVEALRQAGMPFPRFAVDFAITALLALVVVFAYDPLSYGALALLALPLWLGWSAMRSAQDAEQRAEELAGRVRELETLHDTARDLLTARTATEAVDIAQRALRRALDRGDVDVTLQPADSDERVALPVPDAEPAAVLVPADVEDVSVAESVASMLGLALVRQRLEQELAEVQRARAALAGQILEEGVRERSRLAVELHDEVLPQLSGAQMSADNARSALEAGMFDQAERLASGAADEVSAGISRLREVLDTIQRQIIVPGGLHDGLRGVLDDLKLKSGVDGHLDWPRDLPELPYAVEILLLETARGCLANVGNHASAENVQIAVGADEERVRLSISDDGKGFEPDAVDEGHHGLALMRQRAELARGSFTVSSTPGQGTRVEVEVPR